MAHTRIVVETEYPDHLGPKRTVAVQIDQWDPSLEDLYEMFEDVASAMGFDQQSVREYTKNG